MFYFFKGIFNITCKNKQKLEDKSFIVKYYEYSIKNIYSKIHRLNDKINELSDIKNLIN